MEFEDLNIGADELEVGDLVKEFGAYTAAYGFKIDALEYDGDFVTITFRGGSTITVNSEWLFVVSRKVKRKNTYRYYFNTSESVTGDYGPGTSLWENARIVVDRHTNEIVKTRFDNDDD